MPKNFVEVLITGGTIDSFYDGTKDTVVPSESSILPKYFDGLKLGEILKFKTICMKDSRSLTQNDVRRVLNEIENSKSLKFIVTHGTYTMADTARFLKVHLKSKDKVVILTGSLIPLNGFNLSDAGFNLGFAFAKLDSLKPGVYVCMNGKVLTPEEAVKNLREGKFESIFSRL